MIAIVCMKVIGPAVYGRLYVRGKAAGLPTLPFFLNIALTNYGAFAGPSGSQQRSGPRKGLRHKLIGSLYVSRCPRHNPLPRLLRQISRRRAG